MRTPFLALLFAGTAVACSAAAPSAAPPSPVRPRLASQIDGGHAVAQRLCSRCHAVEATGDSPNPKSPPFRVLTGQFVPLTLQRRLSEIAETGHYDMPPIAVHADEVDALAAYINSFGDAWRTDDRPETPR